MLSELVVKSLYREHTHRLSLDKLRHFVETKADRRVEMDSLLLACGTLVKQGRIEAVGIDEFRLVDRPADFAPQPKTILDIIRGALGDTPVPLTVAELTDHVSDHTGRRVSPWTIKTYLSALRSLGFPVRSHGRRPTAYSMGCEHA